VQFEDLIERGTPRAGGAARDPEPAAREEPRASDVRTVGAPSRGLLVLGGLGGVALTIAAVVVFLRGRDAVLASDARLVARHPVDASIPPRESAPDASHALAPDAAPLASDASVVLDAGVPREVVRDAP